MSRKKYISILLLCASICLPGCSAQQSTVTDADPSPTTTEETTTIDTDPEPTEEQGYIYLTDGIVTAIQK